MAEVKTSPEVAASSYKCILTITQNMAEVKTNPEVAAEQKEKAKTNPEVAAEQKRLEEAKRIVEGENSALAYNSDGDWFDDEDFDLDFSNSQGFFQESMGRRAE
ncbi:Hypothetical predicted protein [Paramuricea clavata]|uniref:Uncharacterized protein n=1 Tax=Paramuricea clavata TaxID=317549 RepID=A0A6S7HKA8_PARCT|nr:Hypothetical predicted protein [Paramuricea clavata]